MDKHTLWMAAWQWHTLTRFAGELPLNPGANASDEAARYLCYHHSFGPAQWQAVQTFARDRRAELEGAEIDARAGRFADPETDDGTRFEASGLAQDFRLLCGFGAQYTVNAAKFAHLFLIVRHNLGAPECAAINEFLEAQEAWRADEEGDLWKAI